MISLFFKFTMAFVISFILLSFNIKDQPIFYHITQFTGPLGNEVQNYFGKSVTRSFNKTKEMGRNLFENSRPTYLEDTIGKQQSSLHLTSGKELILEDIRKDEVKKLDELIKKN